MPSDLPRPHSWSYSSLSLYEKCPAAWRYRYVDKLPMKPSPAMERGTHLHSMCETFLTNQDSIVPGALSKIGMPLDRLRIRKAVPEAVWRLDNKWSPCSTGAWVKGIVDVHFFTKDTLHIYDFKTGKEYPTHRDQLELYSLIGLLTYPDVDKAQCGAIYIDAGTITHRRTILREETAAIREGWNGRAEALYADESLEATPGRACYWCDYKDKLGGPCSAWR